MTQSPRQTGRIPALRPHGLAASRHGLPQGPHCAGGRVLPQCQKLLQGLPGRPPPELPQKRLPQKGRPRPALPAWAWAGKNPDPQWGPRSGPRQKPLLPQIRPQMRQWQMQPCLQSRLRCCFWQPQRGPWLHQNVPWGPSVFWGQRFVAWLRLLRGCQHWQSAPCCPWVLLQFWACVRQCHAKWNGWKLFLRYFWQWQMPRGQMLPSQLRQVSQQLRARLRKFLWRRLPFFCFWRWQAWWSCPRCGWMPWWRWFLKRKPWA